MSRKVIILNSAQSDFGEIRAYVKAQFGEDVWKEVYQEFKSTIGNIGWSPESGKTIEELSELGQDNFRIRLVRQTRIVYEYNEKEVLIYMFIHTRQDFRTHLLKHLLGL
ncbi:MAG: type II toxin-antitoxin system RelE/ParE family toxin [Proteobacteria bacterium]|nr:type II toxin-antitoxin system RelE/ParE family toxin [Pseudomonadota bacterium]MCL2306646.1 type II toxin-antitoxin system RelE/ParE family toxin [Pseudomonadota bacterium]